MKMKAAILYQNEKKLHIEEIEKPIPKKDEVLVKVISCGVCHTDIHYLEGVPTFKKPPIVLGHEVLGKVEECPSEVKALTKDDVVIVPPVFTCGQCLYCRSGRENICQNLLMLGNHIDGGYAEFVIAKAKDCIKVNKNSPPEWAIISDALSTPYHAIVNRAKVQSGDIVAIFGCGGVGLNAIQIAKLLGAIVFAIDINEKKLQLAKTFGADYIFFNTPDLPKIIRKESYGGVDIAIDAVGNPTILNTAFSTLKTAGKLIVLGYTDKDATFNAGRIMFREIEILGSLGCPPYLYPKICNLVETDKLKVKELVSHRFTLDKINDALDLLKNKNQNLIRSIITF